MKAWAWASAGVLGSDGMLAPQVRAPGLGANLGSQLLSEPERPQLADAIHYLRLSFAKRLRSREARVESGSFWQKRYHDHNVRDAREFSIKLRYLHRNPGSPANPVLACWGGGR